MDESLKTIERTTLDRHDLFREGDKPKPKPKEGRSSFDDLLDQSRQMAQKASEPKQQSKTLTREALPEVQSFKERQREKGKDSEDKEDQRQEGREKKEGQDGAKKVVGKTGLKQQQGDGHGSGGREGGASSKKGERSFVVLKKIQSQKGVLGTGSANFGKEFQNQLSKVAAHLPKTIPQDIVNQVIRFCRVGKTFDGAKIFELECGQPFFQGLRLRIRSKSGKVSVEFLTAKSDIRELLLKESPQLRETLEKKGIAVETIRVA